MLVGESYQSISTVIGDDERGDMIMQEGRDQVGNPFYWIFTDITPQSFRWFSERSRDSGKTWTMEAEFFAKKQGNWRNLGAIQRARAISSEDMRLDPG